jgi:tRNA nucleotidyltransferase/poly(A) polymerase
VVESIASVGARPLIVGGSVRDAVMGDAAPKDIDIEVHGDTNYETLAIALARIGKVDQVGKSFGVLKVTLPNGDDFDVSLPRRDSKTGQGHKGFEVEVDKNLTEVEAFARRDFTINAIGFDPLTGRVVDPFQGQRDIGDRVLRHVSDAFGEDPLRVLRGAQFAARFQMDMAPETIRVSAALRSEAGTLASERVWGEMEKLFQKGVEPSRGIRILRDTGWADLYPELHGVSTKAMDAAARSSLTGDRKTAAVIAAGLSSSAAQSFLRQMKAPKALQTQAVRLAQVAEMAIAGPASLPRARALVRQLKGTDPADLLTVIDARGGSTDWRRTVTDSGLIRGPRPPIVTGDVLISRGMNPGPVMGATLKRAVEAQDEGLFDDTNVEDWLIGQGL